MKRSLLFCVVVALGCDDGPDATPPPQPSSIVAAFDLPADGSPPPVFDVPFPSDLYREADGTLVNLPGLERLSKGGVNVQSLSETYGAMNGFGATTGVFFAFRGVLDPRTLPGAVALVDIDPASARHGQKIAVDVSFNDASQILSVIPQPGVILEEGTRYAAVVTTVARSFDGRLAAQDPDLTRVLSDEASLPPPLAKAQAILRPAAQELISLGVVSSVSDIAAITSYTTQSVTKDLVTIREMLDQPAIIPAPQVSFPDPALIFDSKAKLDALLGDARDANGVEVLGRDVPGGVAHKHIGVVASGFYPSPRFQPDDVGTEDDERFIYDANGVPILQEAAKPLPIYVVLPDPAQVPMPAGGYPVILVMHGLSSDRTTVWDFGESLAAAGFAMVATEAVDHASRLPGSTDNLNNIGQGPGFLGDPSLRDGVAEVTDLNERLEFFERTINMGGVRDNFRQTIIDLMALARLVREPSLDLSALSGPFGGTAPKLDPSRFFYYGGSFGGICGGIFLAVEPSVRGGVLNVPGGGWLVDILPNAPGIAAILLDVLRALWNLPDSFRLERSDPLLQIVQAVIEPGDPLLYAPHIIKDPFVFNGVKAPRKSVLLVEAIGDELVANPATTGLARAMGVSLASPFYPGGLAGKSGLLEGLPICDANAGECNGNQGGGVTAALTQYSPAMHGTNLSDNKGFLNFIPGFPFPGDQPFPPLPQGSITIHNRFLEGVTAVITFLGDLRDGQTPRVIQLAPPIPDFDDDGALDDVDTAPTDPSVQ